MDLGDCPVCLLPESNCPRFVLPCQDALTSARHNCAQLSQKVAAMWHDLKGIWGVGDVQEENAVSQKAGWYTIRSYLVSCLSKKKKHATFILSQLNYTRTEYCITDLQYVSYSAKPSQCPQESSATLFVILDPPFQQKWLTVAVTIPCLQSSSIWPAIVAVNYQKQRSTVYLTLSLYIISNFLSYFTL